MSGTRGQKRRKVTKKLDKEAVKQQKIAEGKSLISPLILPAYTPEMRLLL